MIGPVRRPVKEACEIGSGATQRVVMPRVVDDDTLYVPPRGLNINFASVDAFKEEKRGVVGQIRGLGPALDREVSLETHRSDDAAGRARQGDTSATLPANNRTEKKRKRCDPGCPHFFGVRKKTNTPRPCCELSVVNAYPLSAMVHP